MIMPFFENDLVRLYHGDCLEVLPELEPEWQACITDPPYFVLPSGKPGDGFTWDRFDSFEDFCEFTSKWVSLVGRSDRLKAMFVFWSIKYLNDGFRLFEPSRLALWRHSNLINVGDMRDFAYDYEPIFVKWYGGQPCMKGDARHLSILDYVKPQSNFHEDRLVHPTQKPVGLIRELAGSLDGVECIIDPFAGSGTLGEACQSLGVRCVLIEREEKYCDIIRRRLESPVQTMLF